MKVYMALRPEDFLKRIDGLALAVREMFGPDPVCGDVFVLYAKRRERIKFFVWD